MGCYSTQRPSKVQERKSPGLTAAIAEIVRKRCVTCNLPLGWDVSYVLHGETASEYEHAVCYYTRCDRDLQVSWVARVTAEPGRLLLGGVRQTTSSRFAQWGQADAFAAQCCKANDDGGHKPTSEVIRIEKAPEVY